MTQTLELTLAEALRLMRERAGFTQTQLASYLELSRNTVSRYEDAITTPKWKDVDAWARICDHDPHIVRQLWDDARKSGCTPVRPPPDSDRYSQLSWAGGSFDSRDTPHVATPVQAA